MARQHVLIVGAGVIGGSLARKLSEDDHYRVHVWAKPPSDKKKQPDTDYLRGLQKKDRRLKNMEVYDDFKKALKTIATKEDAIIVLATPPSTYPDLLAKIAKHAPNAVITDTASVKKPIVQMVERLMRDGYRQLFIPAHPVAGNAGSGAAWSDPELFKDSKNMIVLPPTWDNLAPKGLQFGAALVSQMWMAAGCATNCLISADIHDRIYSAVSHMPHLMAFSLRDMDTQTYDPNSHERQAFYEFARLTDSPRSSFWLDVFHDNRDMIREVIHNFCDELHAVQKMVKDKNWNGLTQYVKESQIPLSSMNGMGSIAKSPLPDDISTRQTVFPIITGAALSKAIGRMKQTLGDGHNPYEYAKSGLKSILSPLAMFQAPTSDVWPEHARRLSVLLDKYDRQLDKTWNAFEETKESAASLQQKKQLANEGRIR